MERRRTRESFTKSLKRICQRINSNNVFDVKWTDPWLYEEKTTSLRIQSLWVLGSYARGATFCGDLDLLADVVVEEGVLPLTPTVSRAVLNSPPDVRLYIGTPDKNSSYVSFPEAKLVWSKASYDYESAIKAIPLDTSAGRYQRKTDILPIRREQIVDYSSDEDLLEKIVDLTEQQILSWEWFPAANISAVPELWPEEAKDFYECATRRMGRKNLELMPMIIEWFLKRNICDLWRWEYGEKTSFKLDGIEVFVGRPWIQLDLLNSLSCSSIAIVPHSSRRGPNGIWVISRGVNHPLEKMFQNRGAFYLINAGFPESPSICHEVFDWRRAYSLAIFNTKRLARSYINDLEYEEMDIAYASGEKLLNMISCIDILEIDSERIAITKDGKFFDEAETLVDPVYLAKQLKNNKSLRQSVANIP